MALSTPHIIGLTGGIGSGKSVVSRLLRLMDVPVYDCDCEAKRLMHQNAEIRTSLIKIAGDKVYLENGQLNRAYLAAFMFGNTERVAQVNHIVHPVVRSDFKQWAKLQGKAIVAVESAILFEAEMDGYVDTVWVVHAPEDIRLNRAVQRDASNAEAVRSRMKSQKNEQDYIHRADRVIYNDGSRSLIKQVKELLREISAK